MLAALAVAAGWFVVTAPSGGAAGPLETAWWWQGEPTTGAVPPPPTVPDGGLWVSSNASGPQSISAARVTLSPDDSAPTLVLDVHQSEPPSSAALVAYPTSTAWSAGGSQAWSSRPTYDANGVHATGAMSTDGKHVTFDLSGLVTGEVLSVVIAPAPASAPPPAPVPSPPAPAPPTFDVTFEKPGPASLQVSPAATLPPDTSAGAAAAAAPPAAAQDLTPLPTDTFSTPAAGLTAPIPATAAPAPTRSAPRATFNNVPRPFVTTSAKRSAGDTAAIAVMLGIVLLWLARDTAAGGAGRPIRLSVYDAPGPAEVAVMSAVRTGTPPPLR